MKRCLLLVLGLLVFSACEDLRRVGPTEPSVRPGAPSGVSPWSPRAALSSATVLRADTIDFSAYTAGTQPSNWSQAWVPSAIFLAANEPAATDGKILQWSSTTLSRDRYALAYDSMGALADQEVYTEFRVHSISAVPGLPAFLGAAGVRLAGVATDPHGYATYFVDNGGARTVALATFVNNTYVQLGDAGYVWQPDVWYSIRLQAVGTHIRLRVWPRGTAEPASWNLDATDTHYSFGKPGVTTHDDGTVQWDLWVGSSLQSSGALLQVQLTPDTASVQAGATQQFQANGLFSDGSSGPIAVNYTATGGTISTNGLYTAGLTAGSYAVIATEPASGLADTSTVTVLPPTPPPGSFTYGTSFGEYQSGAPAGWTATSAPGSVTWNVVADGSVPDARLLRAVSSQTARHMLRFDSVANSTQDEEVLVRIRLTNSNDRGPGIALRHTMSGTTETAYVAYFRPGINGLEVDKFPNGGFSDLADIAFPQTVGSWYWMRFRVQGTTLSLKVWADGGNEPSSWTWTGSDATISSGSVGVYVYEPNTVDYDAFAVGTGGLTAPTPQLGSSSATLTRVLLTPDTVTVQAGATQQFQANGLMSDNTTRPLSVNYSATGGTITAGGLYTAGNTTGTFRVIATEPTSGLADTSTVTIVPASHLSYATSFAEYAPGVAPAGWTATSAPSNVTWTVVTDGSVPDQRLLRAVSSATARHMLRFDSVSSAETDQEVLVRIRLASSNDRGPGIALRHTMSGTTETAYVAYFRPGINGLEVDKFPNGGFTDLADIAFPQTVGNWYWMRFRAQGSTLSLKVWADGSTEPASWTWTGIDATIASGSAGVYVYEPNTVDYDGFGVATGGGTAPTPQIGQSAPTLTKVLLTPDTVSLALNGAQQFQTSGLMSDGSTATVAVNYSATGGTINGSGLYTAGTTAGTFQVIAVEPNSGLADTSTVTILPATLVGILMTPDTATLAANGTKQFTTVGHMSDGSTSAVTPTYSATGGTISSTGLYTAPNAGGTFQVIATVNTFADTSTVTVLPPVVLTAVLLTPDTATVNTGSTLQFHVQGTYSDGSTGAVAVTYSATGGTITAGGLYTAGATGGTYRVIAAAAGGRADTSRVTIPPYYFSYTTDFSEYATGVPANWSKTVNSAQSSWSVVSLTGALGGKVLRGVSNTTALHIFRYNVIPDTTRRQEVLVKLRLANTDTRGPGVALRHTVGSRGNFNAYLAYLRPGVGVEVAAVINAQSATVLTTQSFTNAVGQWYWLRFRADGATLSVRAWADGSTEPTSWLWTGTNSSLAQGSAGVFTNEPNTVDYDAFSFASGGLTAATPSAAPGPNTGPPPPTLQQVVLTPAADTLAVGGTAQFQASGLMSDGTSAAIAVNYTATGGTIDVNGLYTAGSTTGTYSVVATEPTSGLADTSVVTLTPALVSIVMTPDSANLATGSTQQFQVVGRLSDGTTATVTPTFSATGGSITTGGLYTAGGTAGTFQVIATVGTVADTSKVTIVVPTVQLTTRGYKIKGVDTVDLSWTVPAGTTALDIFRNGAKIVSGYSASATVSAGVNYTDNLGVKGAGTFTYYVCDSAHANTCSSSVSVVF